MMKPNVRSLGTFVAGLAIGALTSYILTRQVLKKDYEAKVREEVEDVKQRYKLLRKEGEYSTPEGAAEALGLDLDFEPGLSEKPHEFTVEELRKVADQMQKLGYDPTGEMTKGDSGTVNSNVFDEHGDAGEPVEERDTSRPYVISLDEFMDDNGYDKVTLTYFEGDDTLCDERDMPIPDIDEVIGRDSLNRFGDSSDHRDIVYVRDDMKKMDFEVSRDDQNFTDVILKAKGLPSSYAESARHSKNKKARDDE